MTDGRCGWAGNDPLYIAYHDTEWGVPLHDDRKLFELLILEGMQAGLSWITILRKREAFREAFDLFDPEKVAAYDEEKIGGLMKNAGIIRCRRKIEAAVGNARAFLKIQVEYGSFDRFLWAYVGNTPIVNRWKDLSELPCAAPLSEKLSRDLKERGFRFVGATIMYSFLQAAGVIDDHLITCPCHTENRSAEILPL